ncbi:B3/B4 domain-containing protein [Terrarubrum flagellatum]|uniref:B3/B4 domain-containing protein n=1 Tax=Terrirubrum flagellatum TaxID=2895980 RepID=UPI003145589C
MCTALSIAEIAPRFPKARIAFVFARNLDITTARPPELDALIAKREADCRTRWSGVELSQIPGIAAWREAYKGFGIRKTSYRCSVERLVKRVLAGDRLPEINTLVDIYNIVSLTHVFCSGADDLAKIEGDLSFRFARSDDSFIDMGAAEGDDPNDPPKEGEVVYADAAKVLCRRWNWRQDARSGVTTNTSDAVITVQANGWGDLDAAVADLRDLIGRFAGGLISHAVLDSARLDGAAPG